MVASRLYSIEHGLSAQSVAKMLRVLFPDARTVLDMTYGAGKFWTDNPPWRVTGIDLTPERARDVCADFTRLPFRDGAFDVAIFDPPYQWDEGRSGSIVGRRFRTYRSEEHARETVQLGAAEAWRASRLGVLVKVQNYIHASRLVHMTRWVEEAIPSPLYDEVHQFNPRKLIVPSWGEQRSAYRNHATFLAFRHGSQMHVRRGLMVSEPVEVRAHGQLDLFGSEVAD